MSSEDRVTFWVEMQQKVWHGDTNSKASFITLKRRNSDEIIFRCPVDAENIPTIIKQFLQMQAEELPKGSHAFVLVATDEAGMQLSELPQTVKGSNHEASTAAQEQLALQNATAKGLANLDAVNQILQRNAEQLAEKLGAALEDKFAVLDELVGQRGTNFVAQLELSKFNRNQERLDLLVQNLAPALGVLATFAAEKVLAANPDLLKKMGAKQNVGSATTEKPADSASPSVAEPRQDFIPENTKGGRKGNHRPVPA
jgi:hypothetical protein